MEKKAEKKELKIMLGILLTVAVLAIIVAVVVIAMQSKPGTVLFRGKYDYVDSVMVDGAVVVARDGEYMLVKEDRVISRRYTSLFYDKAADSYSFTSADGYKGEISREGKEIFRRKITGNEISSNNRTADVFYYTETDGIQTVYFGNQSKTLQSGETVYPYASKGLAGLPLGLVLIGKSSGDILTNIAGTLRFSLADCTFHSSMQLVTVNNGGSLKTYRLPDLTEVSFLSGIRSDEILIDKNGAAAYIEFQSAGIYKIFFLNGQTDVSYVMANRPVEIIASQGSGILLALDGGLTHAALFHPSGIVEGRYRKFTDELFFIGNQLFSYKTLQQVSITISDASDCRVLIADTKQYLYLNRALYTFDGAGLTQVLGSAGEVSYRGYDGKLYFLSGGALYNNRLNTIISTGVTSFYGDNLVQKSGSSYANFAGKSIENVREVHTVYGFDDFGITGEYVFETTSGAFYSLSGLVAEKAYGNLLRIYKAKTGGYMLSTNIGFVAGSTVLKSNDYDGYPQRFGESGVAILNGERLDTYQLSAKSEFSLTETRYYSNIRIYSSQQGLIFCDQNQRYGYYSQDGKLVSGPKYRSIELTENFVVAEQENAAYQLFDRSGKRLVADRQIMAVDTDEYSGYIMAVQPNGLIMISKNGSVVSENARGAFEIDSYVTNPDDGAYNAVPESFLVTDSDARYQVFLFGDGMQILKIVQ